MSSRAWQLRVQDILDAVTSIEQRTAEMTFEMFAANETVVKSVLYDFIIIGEASTNIPAEIQSRYSQIPWHLMTHRSLILKLSDLINEVKTSLYKAFRSFTGD